MPRRSTAAAAATYEVKNVAHIPSRLIPIAEIIESPLNPRKTKPMLDAEFLQSIAEDGVLHAIEVRPAEGFEPGIKFEIIAGEQRFRACRAVGRPEIPAVVRKVTNAELIKRALVENLRRRTMSPYDEARGYVDLQECDRAYLDLKVLKARFGKSESYYRDRLKLTRIAPIVAEALAAEAITAKHAETIGTLSPDQHEQALDECFSAVVLEGDRRALIQARDWEALKPALLGYRTIVDWSATHGKGDLTAPEVQQKLRDVVVDGANADDLDDDPDLRLVQLEQAVEEATAELLHLSTVPHLDRATRKALGCIGPEDYKLITREKDRCDSTKRAAIIHGPDVTTSGVRLAEACVDKRGCKKHWAKEQRAAKKAKAERATGGGDDFQAREKKRQEREEAARAAWEAARPTRLRALATIVSKRRLDLVSAIEQQVGTHQLDRVREDFGIALTPKTAALVLTLCGVRTHGEPWFLEDVKDLGVSTKALDAAVAKLTPKSKRDVLEEGMAKMRRSIKPAKKKGGAKK